MSQVATEQQWKSKYRELVDELEDKERAWAKLETALRAAAGKLALAALGQSPELDAAIDHVMAVLRTDATALNLDSSMTGLMRALKAESAVELKSAPAGAARRCRHSPDCERRHGRDRELAARARPPARARCRRSPTRPRRCRAGSSSAFPRAAGSRSCSVADAVGEVASALESQRRELDALPRADHAAARGLRGLDALAGRRRAKPPRRRGRSRAHRAGRDGEPAARKS